MTKNRKKNISISSQDNNEVLVTEKKQKKNSSKRQEKSAELQSSIGRYMNKEKIK